MTAQGIQLPQSTEMLMSVVGLSGKILMNAASRLRVS